MRLLKIFAAVAVVALIGAALMFGFMNKRPSSLSISIHPHPASLAVLRAVVNGADVVDSSLRGRTQAGPLSYQSASGAALSIQLMWYDLDADRYYFKDLSLDSRTFSTYDKQGDRAAVTIEVGPGGDILITTPHPQSLLLVGANRMDEITPEMEEDVVLATLCADPLAKDPSQGGILMRALDDDIALTRAREQRDNWLRDTAAPQPRCKDKDTR